MDLHQTQNLLEKYKQGTCSPAEEKLIDDWLENVKQDKQEYFNDQFIEDQLKLVKKRIDERIGNPQTITSGIHYRWLGIAASLFVLIAATVLILNHRSQKQITPQLTVRPGINEDTIRGWVYIGTQKGITSHFKLSDGSLITLDASTRLRYPVKFTGHKRPVYLDEGEALFEVAKDKTSPFTVYTSKFATTALGTAFNIRSYAKEHKVSISLIHGKIRVDDLHPIAKSTASKILMPHQQIVLNKVSGHIIKTDFTDEAPITAWQNGVLSFRDATMDEVLNSIENRFNVVIQNNSSHTNWSYTGSFNDEPLNDVLKTVCLTEGITYTINNNKIKLN